MTTLENLTNGRELWFQADDRARLFAREVGSGAPVVFLHGGLADHRTALFHVQSLGRAHRLVCPDLRGAGRSRSDGPLSWDRLAADVAALLAHLGVDRAVVGGTSMGSGVAVRFALRHPRLLRGLILMSPVYPGADRPLSPAAETAMKAMGEVGERVLVQGVPALRPLFEGLPPPVRKVALEMMRGFEAASVAATTRFLALCDQPLRSAAELRAIDVPVLVLPGVDAQHPAEIAHLYAQHLRRPVVADLQARDLPERLAGYCDALP